MQICQWVLCYFYIAFKGSWTVSEQGLENDCRGLLPSLGEMYSYTHIQAITLPDWLTISAKVHLHSAWCGELAKNWYALKPYKRKELFSWSVGICPWLPEINFWVLQVTVKVWGQTCESVAVGVSCDSSHGSEPLCGVVAEDGPVNTAVTEQLSVWAGLPELCLTHTSSRCCLQLRLTSSLFGHALLHWQEDCAPTFDREPQMPT